MSPNEVMKPHCSGEGEGAVLLPLGKGGSRGGRGKERIIGRRGKERIVGNW